MSVLGTSGVILLALVLVGLMMINRQSKSRVAYAFGAEKACDDILVPTDSDEQVALMAYADADSPVAVAGGFGGSGSASTADATEARPALRLRWGRMAIFGAGALFLLVSGVTALVAAFTALTFVTPVLFLLLALGCLVALRVLALRDRDRRRASTAMKVEQSKKLHRPERPTLQEKTQASRAEIAPGEEKPRRATPTLPARAQATLPVSHAAKALRKARTQHQPVRIQAPAESKAEEKSAEPTRLRMDEALPDTRWTVTEVPRPTYLDAPVAQRKVVEPVETVQAPQSTSQTLAEAAGMNLDEVLRRRRA
ncbi:hypothetical protein [Rothia nasimurium]|uniref:hypothetical protein n=1 Tax=Rothia nasimurium TaxID=85336 RepID=UPI003BA00C15